MLQHEYSKPVTLTMIVSALILDEQNLVLSLNKFYTRVIKVYSYFVKKGGVRMIMNQAPDRRDVTETIEKLGFQIRKVLGKGAAENKMEVLLHKREDNEVYLGLAYYRNSLI